MSKTEDSSYTGGIVTILVVMAVAVIYVVFFEGQDNRTGNAEESASAGATDSSVQSTAVESETYSVTAESRIDLVFTRVSGSEEGGFKKIAGSIEVANGRMIAEGSILTVDAGSVYTKDPRLTQILRSTQGIIPELYPKITASLKEVVHEAGSDYRLIADVSALGVKRPVRIPVTVLVVDHELRITGKAFIQRSLFGSTYPGDDADDPIRNEFLVRLDLRARPQGKSKSSPASESHKLTRAQNSGAGLAANSDREQDVQKFDEDGDGQLSMTERQAMGRQRLQKFDTNGDGRIDTAEQIAAGLRPASGAVAPVARAKATIPATPPSHPQRQLPKTNKLASTETSAESVFVRLDGDNDGQITSVEAGESRWKTLRRADGDKNSTISLKELQAIQKKVSAP